MDAPAIRNISDEKIKALLPGIDLLLVTTTSVERDALLRKLRPLPHKGALLRGSAGRITVTLGQFGRYFAAHVETTQGSVGRAASMATVADAIREVAPKAVLVLGIAFGLDPSRQRMGDVLVAESVIPYEPARVDDEHRPRGEMLPAGTTLCERFRTRSTEWEERRGDERVNVFRGQVLSGEKLIDSRSFLDSFLEKFPSAIGGEMEGAGAYAAADREKVEILLVKSISDFADGEKSDEAQPWASSTAVSLAWHVLAQPDVLRALGATDHDPPDEPAAVATFPRRRLVEGIDALPGDWASRIGGFIDAYVGTSERPNVFCGREEDVDQIQHWLDREDAPTNLLVTAPAGRGKSALLVRFAMRLAERDDVDIAFVPWSLRFETHRPDVFLGCLVSRLAFLHGREPPDLRHTNVDVLQRLLYDELSRPRAKERPLVVILDGLDEAAGFAVRPGLLPARHAESVRLILSARHKPDDPKGDRWLRALGWEGPGVAERVLLPLLDTQAVEATLRRLPSPLDRLSSRHDVVNELRRICAGEPLTLWLMMGEIAALGEAAVDLDASFLRISQSRTSA